MKITRLYENGIIEYTQNHKEVWFFLKNGKTKYIKENLKNNKIEKDIIY